MKTNCVSVHKNAKRDLGQYPAILTSRLVNNLYSYSVLTSGALELGGRGLNNSDLQIGVRGRLRI